MTRWEAWCMHLATLLVGGTGLVYAVMRYLLRSEDPYAVVNHPWQPHAQHLHVLTAPLLVFAVGLLWRSHVLVRLRNRAAGGRRSGWAVLLTLVPMIASGYLIQVAVAPGWRRAWIVVHCVSAGLWLAGYLIHQVAVPRTPTPPLSSVQYRGV